LVAACHEGDCALSPLWQAEVIRGLKDDGVMLFVSFARATIGGVRLMKKCV
jgi:hypothetical protein